ncbi:FxsB family cyclophane-forming radical SAM/SPASM peptide maturase [Actinoplanes sp. NPDC026670]|uniref:FxsB family cyclophane-forming radical SAM/SPASM peptide maturase n=1 Tax=Actinoplanes sp. NPDC026670 TaxID=3154700 RepID=UPI0033DC8881
MTGRQPDRAFAEFVVKVHSRCDLACDHCYVFEHADQSWRRRPARIATETLQAAAQRIAEHAEKHGLAEVSVILHGGEPLLLGPARMREILTELHNIISPFTTLHVGMQTNGILLTERFAQVLADFDVRIGVSLDGDRSANDLHRRFRNGNSSHDQVVRALEILRRPQFRRIYSGLLCTVDVRSDPIRVYEALLAQDPPRIDFLLPHATWDSPPWRPDGAGAPYAAWLSAIYRRWISDGRPVAIRLFDSLLALAEGRPSGTEWVGLDPVALAVIETDGEWEQADSLKTAFDGAASTGMTVFTHSADDVAATPEMARRRAGLGGLSPVCQSCPVVAQCGGGLFAHRYGSGTFDHPSVYCADLKELIMDVNDNPPPAPTDVDPSLLPPAMLDGIAVSAGDGAAVKRLEEAQTAIIRALLVKVGQGLETTGPSAQNWATLTRLDHDHPDAVSGVLAHPYIRSWAVELLSGAGTGTWQGPGYLGSIAAAAAFAAGAAVRVFAPVRDGRVHLPTLGTVLLGAGGPAVAEVRTNDGEIRITVEGETVAVRPGERADARWLPNRRLTADGLTLLLEDLDPHRDCHKLPAADRLDEAAAGRWADTFAEAWRIVRDEVPDHAEELRVGLRAIVPVRLTGDGKSEASTARQAFGSVAVTETDPASLAVLLVHEFQHSKMNALLDICNLVDITKPNKITVGWRPDPRPAEAVLHGIYAHTAVAGIWRVRTSRKIDGAEAVFEQYRAWTTEAIQALERADALTPDGQRLLRKVSGVVSGWRP